MKLSQNYLIWRRKSGSKFFLSFLFHPVFSKKIKKPWKLNMWFSSPNMIHVSLLRTSGLKNPLWGETEIGLKVVRYVFPFFFYFSVIMSWGGQIQHSKGKKVWPKFLFGTLLPPKGFFFQKLTSFLYCYLEERFDFLSRRKASPTY